MKNKIAISGSYGGMNLGDEAILEGILRELKGTADAEVVVFSNNPKDTEERHKARAIPIREMHKKEVLEELKTIDLLILGGGRYSFRWISGKYSTRSRVGPRPRLLPKPQLEPLETHHLQPYASRQGKTLALQCLQLYLAHF